MKFYQTALLLRRRECCLTHNQGVQWHFVDRSKWHAARYSLKGELLGKFIADIVRRRNDPRIRTYVNTKEFEATMHAMLADHWKSVKACVPIEERAVEILCIYHTVYLNNPLWYSRRFRKTVRRKLRDNINELKPRDSDQCRKIMECFKYFYANLCYDDE